MPAVAASAPAAIATPAGEPVESPPTPPTVPPPAFRRTAAASTCTSLRSRGRVVVDGGVDVPVDVLVAPAEPGSPELDSALLVAGPSAVVPETPLCGALPVGWVLGAIGGWFGAVVTGPTPGPGAGDVGVGGGGGAHATYAQKSADERGAAPVP